MDLLQTNGVILHMYTYVNRSLHIVDHCQDRQMNLLIFIHKKVKVKKTIIKFFLKAFDAGQKMSSQRVETILYCKIIC